MLAVKAFRQDYEATPEIKQLLETFRLMVNTCVRLGLQSGVTSRNGLTRIAYPELAGFRLHTTYRLYATSVAVSVLKNYRKAARKGLNPGKPYVKRMFAIFGALGKDAMKIEDGKLKLPIAPREWLHVPLSKYVLENLSHYPIKPRSVVLTTSTIVITVSKNVEPIEPRNYVGIDINEDSAITASEEGTLKTHSFREVPKIISIYRNVVSHFRRNDYRAHRQIAYKYGAKRRNRVVQRLHKVSKAIVEEALEKKQGIILEKLTGIRDRHRRGNSENRGFRHRLNSWPFHELQRQIIYKAAWNGIPTLLIDPRRTSRTCSECGNYVPKVQKWLVCHACGSIINRHENAAKNILARGLRFGPVAPKIEAMMPERVKA